SAWRWPQHEPYRVHEAQRAHNRRADGRRADQRSRHPLLLRHPRRLRAARSLQKRRYGTKADRRLPARRDRRHHRTDRLFDGWRLAEECTLAEEARHEGDHGMKECKLIHPTRTYQGKQSLTYWEGVARETVGSERICMHLLRIPPGSRAVAHLHAMHETAIYMLDGVVDTWYGDNLEHLI